MITGEPSLLLFRGQFSKGRTPANAADGREVLAVVRAQRLPAIEGVEAVVLETGGSLSVIRRGDGCQVIEPRRNNSAGSEAFSTLSACGNARADNLP